MGTRTGVRKFKVTRLSTLSSTQWTSRQRQRDKRHTDGRYLEEKKREWPSKRQGYILDLPWKLSGSSCYLTK